MNSARLAARMFGTGNVLIVHRFTLDLLKGDHLAALFLEQLIYWTERTNNPDGWIVKTYAEWENELRLSKYLVSRIVDTLAPFGVETTLRRSPFHKMQPVLHYRVNLSVLEVKIRELIESEEISLPGSEETSLSITETTSETTVEVYAPDYEPPSVRALRNDTAAHTNGWTLVDAYATAVGIAAETIYSAPGAKKVAAGLSRAQVTAEDVTAFMAELRNQKDRWSGYRFGYLAEDLPRWKQQRAEQPTAPRVLSDFERAVLNKAREEDQRQWWKEQGLL